MKKRITAAILAACLALALAACGQAKEPELNIDEFGEELYAAGTFGEELYPIDESVAQGLYGLDADTRCWVRTGTGATAEELAVFETKDSAAAEALVEKLKTRNSDRIESYSTYIPAEVPKLEDAVMISGGRYVVLCVAQDASAVRELAQKALG
ncbi:MAG TPA: DUF4358 domain-containing protein [Candidatus Scatomorpha merdavium]|jgi:hypothetical protein|nr:DUF4358 domain-containing protein [Candidatus Scatomorpha merdavium]